MHVRAPALAVKAVESSQQILDEMAPGTMRMSQSGAKESIAPLFDLAEREQVTLTLTLTPTLTPIKMLRGNIYTPSYRPCQMD